MKTTKSTVITNGKYIYALLSLLSLCLLAYNTTTIFTSRIPLPAKVPSKPASFAPEKVAGKPRNFVKSPSSTKLSLALKYSVKKLTTIAKLKTHLPLLHKNQNSAIFLKKGKVTSKNQFEFRVLNFFQDPFCKFRFFMTWISSAESFGEREFFSIESLFKSHPNGCLIVVSDSMDSITGIKILTPFVNQGFKVTSVAPDFNHLFKFTPAQDWYNRLMRGKVQPGDVPLGQNLSNLLRLGLLYKFGGIYIDTDVIILRSFNNLRNSIGAQTIDLETGNWSRLNNAVMIFDEGHQLLYRFIEEFALTFDGNKWGHNGPYLVSRVVSRGCGCNFTVLPPMAFYPVDWSRIRSFFQGPMSLSHSKWIVAKLRQIRSQSFGVHLWNKQSRGIRVEKGSIIQHIMFSSCVFCNSSNRGIGLGVV